VIWSKKFNLNDMTTMLHRNDELGFLKSYVYFYGYCLRTVLSVWPKIPGNIITFCNRFGLPIYSADS